MLTAKDIIIGIFIIIIAFIINSCFGVLVLIFFLIHWRDLKKAEYTQTPQESTIESVSDDYNDDHNKKMPTIRLKKGILPPSEEYSIFAPLELNREIEVDSLFDSSITYIINPWEMTCTCDDFIKNRSQYESGDIRRTCLHLARYYYKNSCINGELENLVLDKCRYVSGIPHYIYLGYMFDESEVLFATNKGWNYIMVFSRKKRNTDSDDAYWGKYVCNEYSLSTNEWQNYSKPDGEYKILRIMEQIFN